MCYHQHTALVQEDAITIVTGMKQGLDLAICYFSEENATDRRKNRIVCHLNVREQRCIQLVQVLYGLISLQTRCGPWKHSLQYYFTSSPSKLKNYLVDLWFQGTLQLHYPTYYRLQATFIRHASSAKENAMFVETSHSLAVLSPTDCFIQWRDSLFISIAWPQREW